MRKLRLELETLAVESFETHRAPERRGTVDGNQIVVEPVPLSRSNCADCYYTIIATCLSCGEEECTFASYSQCPSCLNSCHQCQASDACPVVTAPTRPVPGVDA